MFQPEIVYEESTQGRPASIPFIIVPDGGTMPTVIYIFESRDTGEIESTSTGEQLPVMQWDLHQYADMNFLKTRLDPAAFDNVRAALGLEPVSVAASKGEKITQEVRKNLE